MAALSLALGNRVWCDGWARPIYPNLWIVVIAQSGYGKSVPLDMIEAMVRKAGLEASVLPDSFSQEALYTMLSQKPAGIFYLQEFSAFLGALQRDYNYVDAETEILTRRGWKRNDQLEVGEDVLSVKRNSGGLFLEWTPVEAIHRYHVVDEELLSFEGRTVSMLVTKNHQMVTNHADLFPACSLPHGSMVPQTARWSGGYGRECTNRHLAALIGWYVTEGWDDKKAIRIAQKSRIAELLRSLSGYWRAGQRGLNSDVWEQHEHRGPALFLDQRQDGRDHSPAWHCCTRRRIASAG